MADIDVAVPIYSYTPIARISDNVYPLPPPVKLIQSPVLVLNR